jgi:hypothetical protein
MQMLRTADCLSLRRNDALRGTPFLQRAAVMG